jgi:hypothetical protein
MRLNSAACSFPGLVTRVLHRPLQRRNAARGMAVSVDCTATELLPGTYRECCCWHHGGAGPPAPQSRGGSRVGCQYSTPRRRESRSRSTWQICRGVNRKPEERAQPAPGQAASSCNKADVQTEMHAVSL